MKKTATIIVSIVTLLAVSCTKDPQAPERGTALAYRTAGEFSVSENLKVRFSPGNLQYRATTHEFRFAEHQWDYIGDDNINIGSNYDGWINLFGWGTSGFMIAPYTSTQDPDAYTNDGNSATNNNYDWGVFNAIVNGGNTQGAWRTLSSEEWEYLLDGREKADQKVAPALVCDVPGIVILSDYFAVPDSCVFAATFDNGFESNIYDEHFWNKMAAAGAVFLPAAGYRDGAVILDCDEYGAYWSTTFNPTHQAFAVCFSPYQISIPLLANQNFYGNSVRLVQNITED